MDFTAIISPISIEHNYSYRGLELDVAHTRTATPQKYIIKEDDEIAFSDFTVKWTLEIEARDWGVKGLMVYATKVNGSMFISEIDEDGNEAAEYEFVLPETFKIETKDSECRKLIDDITPQEIEIDLKNKSITILF